MSTSVEKRPSVLEVEEVSTGYGKLKTLNAVSLEVASGEIVAVVGHNGAGKSTLLKVIFSLLPIWSGSIIFDGTPVVSVNPRELLRAGVTLVPQGNRVFSSLTVREHLLLAARALSKESQLERQIAALFSLFPKLRERASQRAGSLAGGEKQMLALASAVLQSPKLLLLDEPSLGLAPPLVADAMRMIEEASREDGTAVLIVEQKVREVLKIADRVYVLRRGTVVFTGPAKSLEDEDLFREVYL